MDGRPRPSTSLNRRRDSLPSRRDGQWQMGFVGWGMGSRTEEREKGAKMEFKPKDLCFLPS